MVSFLWAHEKISGFSFIEYFLARCVWKYEQIKSNVTTKSNFKIIEKNRINFVKTEG